jgi:hypothetical protein
MAYGKDEKKDVTDLAENIKEKLDNDEIDEDPMEKAVNLPDNATFKTPDDGDKKQAVEKAKTLTTSITDRNREKSFLQRNRQYQTQGTLIFDLYGHKYIKMGYDLEQFQVPNPKDMMSGDVDPNRIFNPVTKMDIFDEVPETSNPETTWTLTARTDQSWFEGMSTDNGALLRGANADFEVGLEQYGGHIQLNGVTMCVSKRFFDSFVLYMELKVDANFSLYRSNTFGGCVEGEINKLLDLVKHPTADDSLYKVSPTSMDLLEIKSIDRSSVHYYDNVNFELHRVNSEYKELESDQYVLED